MTMLEIVIPMTASRAKHSKNEVGIAKPTNRVGRVSKDASTTIMTKAMAFRTDPSSWLTIVARARDWSFDVPIWTAACNSGDHSARASATV